MTSTKSNTLSFTGILVQDEKTKGFTAFFKQFPNVIAEGDTEDQAMENLISTLRIVLKSDTEQVINDLPRNHVIKKTVEFQAIA